MEPRIQTLHGMGRGNAKVLESHESRSDVFFARGCTSWKIGKSVRPASETLTLLQTKICDFPNPISDQIKNLIMALFQTWPLNQYPFLDLP